MRQAIYSVAPGARLVRMGVPPVVGAVVLGMEQGGIEPSPLRSILIESTEELLKTREQQ
jgi:hypothetical protein